MLANLAPMVDSIVTMAHRLSFSLLLYATAVLALGSVIDDDQPPADRTQYVTAQHVNEGEQLSADRSRYATPLYRTSLPREPRIPPPERRLEEKGRLKHGPYKMSINWVTTRDANPQALAFKIDRIREIFLEHIQELHACIDAHPDVRAHPYGLPDSFFDSLNYLRVSCTYVHSDEHYHLLWRRAPLHPMKWMASAEPDPDPFALEPIALQNSNLNQYLGELTLLLLGQYSRITRGVSTEYYIDVISSKLDEIARDYRRSFDSNSRKNDDISDDEQSIDSISSKINQTLPDIALDRKIEGLLDCLDQLESEWRTKLNQRIASFVIHHIDVERNLAADIKHHLGKLFPQKPPVQEKIIVAKKQTPSRRSLFGVFSADKHVTNLTADTRPIHEEDVCEEDIDAIKDAIIDLVQKCDWSAVCLAYLEYHDEIRSFRHRVLPVFLNKPSSRKVRRTRVHDATTSQNSDDAPESINGLSQI